MDANDRIWWKESVVYQIYPRSFMDSDGDGVGDLKGILSKLDYLKNLGVDILWLSPIFESPNDDNGYDISDYCAIMDEFGTMDDFDELLKAVKARDLKLILDLVPNHTSDEHKWFKEARKSKDNPYRDYYHWRAPLPDVNGTKKPPNDWQSFFEGSVWELTEETNEYFLHLFTKKQPDLNWANPKVRQEMYDIMRFWLDKGIDGFRIDVVSLISKDLAFPNYPKDYNGNFPRLYANGPKVHEYLQEMHEEVLAHYDMLTVGEGPGITVAEGPLYVGKDRKELHSIYHFDLLEVGRAAQDISGEVNWILPQFKQICRRWDEVMDGVGWNSVMLGNHDFPRMVSRFGNDSKFHEESAKMLATFLMTQRGTPYIYQGDEFGMTNVAFESIEDYNDVWVKNTYAKLKAQQETGEAEQSGGNLDWFLKSLHVNSRDNARTPVQWDNTTNAGFTTGTPWLKINKNYKKINAKNAVDDHNSIYYFFKKMIAFRKAHPSLIYGSYTDIDPEHLDVFIYKRSLDQEQFLVVLNFSEKELEYSIPAPYRFYERTLKMGNYTQVERQESAVVSLKPFEAKVYEIE